MKCLNCKKEIDDDSLFCEYCGTRVQKKSKKWLWVGIALVACILVIVGINSLIEYSEEKEMLEHQEYIAQQQAIEEQRVADSLALVAQQQAEEAARQAEITRREEAERQRQAELQRQREAELEHKVFSANEVDEQPKIPGYESFNDYIVKNINLKNVDTENMPESFNSSSFSFVIWKDGQIRDIKLQSPSVVPSLDTEITRVLKTLPNVVPGKLHGNSVNVYYEFTPSIEIEIKIKRTYHWDYSNCR